MNTSKNWLWTLIAVTALALLLAAWQYGIFNSFLNNGVPLSAGDTTTDINNDLNAVDVGNPEEDLKQLDADLNQL